jgi:SAM-dependent methyltransferase
MSQVRISEQAEYQALADGPAFRERAELERCIAARAGWRGRFTLLGTCRPCRAPVEFLVDRKGGATKVDGIWIPNWRERLVCPRCGLNNRQRAMAAALEERLAERGPEATVYLMEQVTPFFSWVKRRWPEIEITGSEYLGPSLAPGSVIDGIRHEDASRLSFSDQSLDIVVSNDVLEHVPDPSLCLREIGRVLKPDGCLLMTVPFHSDRSASVARAELVNGQIVERLPAVYHGNPISREGSLVFTDFGFDLLQKVREAGFSPVSAVVYWSIEHGHLGGPGVYFEATRAGHRVPGAGDPALRRADAAP